MSKERVEMLRLKAAYTLIKDMASLLAYLNNSEGLYPCQVNAKEFIKDIEENVSGTWS